MGGQWYEMGGDERVVALWVMSERVERWRKEELRKLREQKLIKCRVWERRRNCKMFYWLFKCKKFYHFCLWFFLWLKIFYIWLIILLQNKHCKIWKYFTSKQTERNTLLFFFFFFDKTLVTLKDMHTTHKLLLLFPIQTHCSKLRQYNHPHLLQENFNTLTLKHMHITHKRLILFPIQTHCSKLRQYNHPHLLQENFNTKLNKLIIWCGVGMILGLIIWRKSS